MTKKQLWEEVCYYVMERFGNHSNQQKLACGKYKGLTGKWPEKGWSIDDESLYRNVRAPDKSVSDEIDRQYAEWQKAHGRVDTPSAPPDISDNTFTVGTTDFSASDLWVEVCHYVAANITQQGRRHKIACGKFKGLTGNWPARSWGYADQVADPPRAADSDVVTELDRQYKEWKTRNKPPYATKASFTDDDDDDFTF